MNLQALRDYLIARAKEASTWRGLITILTGLGVAMNPEMIESIVSLGLVLAGVVGAAFPDNKPAQ